MLVHSCIWAFVAETEMESDRHRWAFDSETHTYSCILSPMVRHRCIGFKPRVSNEFGQNHKTKRSLCSKRSQACDIRGCSTGATCARGHTHINLAFGM